MKQKKADAFTNKFCVAYTPLKSIAGWHKLKNVLNHLTDLRSVPNPCFSQAYVNRLAWAVRIKYVFLGAIFKNFEEALQMLHKLIVVSNFRWTSFFNLGPHSLLLHKHQTAFISPSEHRLAVIKN